jgi:hypothetical protein
MWWFYLICDSHLFNPSHKEITSVCVFATITLDLTLNPMNLVSVFTFCNIHSYTIFLPGVWSSKWELALTKMFYMFLVSHIWCVCPSSCSNHSIRKPAWILEYPLVISSTLFSLGWETHTESLKGKRCVCCGSMRSVIVICSGGLWGLPPPCNSMWHLSWCFLKHVTKKWSVNWFNLWNPM